MGIRSINWWCGSFGTAVAGFFPIWRKVPYLSQNRYIQCFFPISEVGKKIRIKTKIQIVHFPVVLNHATTRHKLQGKSLDALGIAQWSKAKNLAYVVISRVRTLAGLFLTQPIPDDIDFMPSADYLAMMENLRNTILATPDQVETLKSDFNPDSLI